MRLHPYIFKIKKDERIEYFQGSLSGIEFLKPCEILEIRENTKFTGERISEYFETLELKKKTA